MRSNYLLYLPLILMLSLFSCKEETREERLAGLPPSIGKEHEIMLVMDSGLYQTALGDTLRSIFLSDLPGLPRPEPRFKLTRIQPEQLTRFIKSHTNLIFVTSFSDRSRGGRVTQSYFTDEARKQMREDTSRFYLVQKDAFAKGQTLVHLFAEDTETLLRQVSFKKEQLLSLFQDKEMNAMRNMVYGPGYQRELSEQLYEDYGFWIKVPAQYQVAKDTTGFVWLRKYGQEVDRSIVIAYEDYLSQEQFNPYIIEENRDDLGRHHIFGSGSRDTTSYMMRQTIGPSHSREVTFNGKYAVEIRGLWKLKNISMGGPYLSYTLLDTVKNRVYYLEGFAYSPGLDQRDFMLELEVELHTFSATPPDTVASN